MITVFGEGRGFRVIWMLEELGLPYEMKPVDLLGDAPLDPEFLAANPAGFIPTLVDGEITMVESIAILEYLAARYGPTPLVPAVSDAAFPAYQQFLHLGEAGLAGPINAIVATFILAPETERENYTTRWAQKIFEGRRGLVERRLARSRYLAGETFTAADISVTYALQFARRTGNAVLTEAEQAYLARTTGREAYARAMDACPGTKAWAAGLGE